MRFDRTDTAAELHDRYADLAPDARTGSRTSVAGRVTSIRGHGKLEFVTLQDVSGSDSAADERLRCSTPRPWRSATGSIWATGWARPARWSTSRRGELSVEVTSLTPLSKALRPLPDKWHGLSDEDMRYRQREVDLLANPDSRRVFDVRFKTLASMRQTFTDEGFVEVETPILQSLAGGAIARPFVTHSNALDIDLSLRIAPELFLKRLVVGGYERVFEIAAQLPQRGHRHPPQPGVHLPRGLPRLRRRPRRPRPDGAGHRDGRAAPRRVDSPSRWVIARWTSRRPGPGYELLDLLEEAVGRRVHPSDPVEDVRAVCAAHDVPFMESWGSGKLIFEMYDKILQGRVLDPQFITGFPVEVSPLARHRPDDPTLADRFELVIDAKELANGYSELNVPEEQEARFVTEAAAAAAGDQEAHPADRAFVRALEYGLPPTSGIGIGLDRLVMLLAEVTSIRDVILFPILRPEAME